VQAEGSTLGAEVERAERSRGLHKRSAEDWGDGLGAREGSALLGNWKIERYSDNFVGRRAFHHHLKMTGS
jgi:hypothetical protein